MRHRHRQGGQTLIVIALGILLLGGAGHAAHALMSGGALANVRKGVGQWVTDPDRQAPLMAELDAWESEQKELERRFRQLESRLAQTMERHDATKADFEQVFDDADRLDAELRDRFLERRTSLRAQLTESEWVAVFATKH